MTADHDRRSADDFADDFERRAARARRAAESERRTEEHLDRELRRLGYHCLHDCRWPGSRNANIDHVVIGPSGVWIVDDKVMTQPVYVGRNGSLRSGRYSMTKAVLKAHAQVEAVRTAIGAADARGILSIHHAELSRPAFEVDAVHVAKALWPTSRIIHGAPNRLHRDEVERLADRASRVLQPRSYPRPIALDDDREISVADVLDPRLPPPPLERPVRAPRRVAGRAGRSRRVGRRRSSMLVALRNELLRVVLGVVAAIVAVVIALQALNAVSRSMLDAVTKPTVTYTCMQPGQPGRTLRVHWSDAGVTAVLWRSDATATWEPLVMQPTSNAERGYLLPGQTSHVRLERSGGKTPLELTSTVPSTPAC